MFFIRKPSQRAIEQFLTRQRNEGFCYNEVGSTREGLPQGYTVDHNRVRLGQGRETFNRATESLRGWQMFKLGWIELFPANAPIEVHANVVILIRHFRFYSLNACRIVYVINEDRRFGFAYGTLYDHAEQGEERFSVEWLEDDSVWYDSQAFSRPRLWPARIARPAARLLQKRFAHDSMAAMKTEKLAKPAPT